MWAWGKKVVSVDFSLAEVGLIGAGACAEPAFHGLKEARSSGTTIELGLSLEQRQVAGSADIETVALFLVEGV